MNVDSSVADQLGLIKCVVWDLDHTLWDGILSEGDDVAIAQETLGVLKRLDQRGILFSIASKNDAPLALDKLKSLGVADYFLYPQISWSPKSDGVGRIAHALNIGIDAIAFVDDQPFERDEVVFAHPQVTCLDATQIPALVNMPELTPRFITDESSRRRLMYQQDALRSQVEDDFSGPKEDFLASLKLSFTVKHADKTDLRRLEELTARTNQLNTTGRIYSYDELEAFRVSEDHALLVASLDDKYGSYGSIGLALLEFHENVWNIKLLLMSCRVMSRGVGNVLLGHIINASRHHGVVLRSHMIPTSRNRLMYATYRFAGFQQVGSEGEVEVLEFDLNRSSPMPSYVRLHYDVDNIISSPSNSSHRAFAQKGER